MILRDETVEEVRANREAYAARFNFDLRRMYQDLKAKELLHSRAIAPLEPLKPRTIAPIAD